MNATTEHTSLFAFANCNDTFHAIRDYLRTLKSTLLLTISCQRKNFQPRAKAGVEILTVIAPFPLLFRTKYVVYFDTYIKKWKKKKKWNEMISFHSSKKLSEELLLFFKKKIQKSFSVRLAILNENVSNMNFFWMMDWILTVIAIIFPLKRDDDDNNEV